MTVAAVLLSLFMPLIALIVALVMRAGELRPSRRGFLITARAVERRGRQAPTSRRAFLKTWAITAGAWMCAVWAFAMLLFAVAASTMSQMP